MPQTLIAAIAAFIFLPGCSSSSGDLPAEKFYPADVTTVVYEVDYMEGMDPYVGETIEGDPYWDFLKNNISALFEGKKAVQAPTMLSEMEEIPAGGENYSSDDILALAETYRTTPALKDGVASIYIVFLDGYFVDDGEPNDAVLGVSIGDTGVIGLFKKAITSNTFPSSRLRTFVEQSVLIHESGHALGLVNNGVSMTTAHQDSEHGAHCTNTNCVMYYLNEGAQDLLEFLLTENPSTESVIFGSECLADTAAALN